MNWDPLFKQHGRYFHNPHANMNAFVALLKKEKAQRVLDLGCGSGRHTVFLASKGFHVTALDNSDEGIQLTRQWLKKRGERARLVKGNAFARLPFPSHYFDAVVSVQVLHHGKIIEIRRAIQEVHRVLRKKGWAFITLTKIRHRFKGSKVKELAPRTYWSLNGYEKGAIHYLFTKEKIREEFNDFDVGRIWLDTDKYYCFFARKNQD
ncbi:class I SAM-dependent methyltransferase [Candidatus Micrarchaeota archaeon]|nr:class I SAM-dependent methyltransferase [Candidatus Micrarchaeota archaeon]